MHDSFHVIMHQRRPVVLQRGFVFLFLMLQFGGKSGSRVADYSPNPPPRFKVRVLELKRPDSSGGSEDTQA